MTQPLRLPLVWWLRPVALAVVLAPAPASATGFSIVGRLSAY